MIYNGPIVSVRFIVCLGALTVRKSAAHPSTAIMVKEALKALDSRKGVSSQAMQNYIKQKYPSVDVVRLKHLVRRALKKGIESGALVRPANSNVSTGATGKFRLAPKDKEPKSKSENADPNVPKEAKEKAAKKPPKAGAEKNEAAKEGGKPEEDSKPPKRPKKDQTGTSKVAPAKKPKAKKMAENGNDKDTSASATTTTKEPKAGKATRQKMAKKESDAPAAKTTRKRGKKAAE
uniref:H15 domain-containing protein n=1 Tax=Takifugu rubripes TaxID=31033 RepID=A0A674NSE1_TAKRU